MNKKVLSGIECSAHGALEICCREQFYNVILDGCTILADNLAFSHTFDKTAFPSGLPTLNTAFARVCWLGSLVYSNCAFAAGTTFTKSSDALFANVNPVLNITDFKIDDEGRPDRDSPLVDAGDASLVASAERPAADRMLTPRVLNGAIDIGAYEYDWRKDFSKTLARRRLTVTEVTPGATLVDNALVWSDGEMALEWARGGGELPYTFTLSVGAGGSLAVMLNGAPLGTYGEGTQTVRFSSTEALNQMRFIASGEASVRAFDHRSGLLLLVR